MTLLLHPGFHKTATSWLQDTVFAEPRLFRSLMTHQQVDELLVRPHDFDFDPAAVRDHIASLKNGSHSHIVDVISSEILSGNILLGSRDSYTLAERLAATCGPAKVLLTVRAQQPILKSIYLQYIKRGGRLPLEAFLTFRPEPGYFWFDPGTLKFDRVAQAYANRFGADNILVLPQELLARDRPQYLRLLFAFAGLPHTDAEDELSRRSASGVSPPVSGVAILRAASWLRPSPFNPKPQGSLDLLGKLAEQASYRWTWGEKRASSEMKRTIAKLSADRYGASNRRLQKFVPVDLSQLGYDVA